MQKWVQFRNYIECMSASSMSVCVFELRFTLSDVIKNENLTNNINVYENEKEKENENVGELL